MTAPERASASPVPPEPLAIAADGSYAARLVTVRNEEGNGEGWCPERWTLDGPEPYAVRLPAGQPEEATSPVLPLADGRVLIGRLARGRFHFELLYPSSPDTGHVPLGAVDGERLRLLPPVPDGARAYALVESRDADGAATTALWLVCGGAFGPELVTVLPGHCAGGAWLDREGRLLALDRTDAEGRTRALAVDVLHGGEPSELLRIAEDSNDRLLLADPDSGLLLVSSDAPGEERIGWGVLGSHRPVRFPEALHVPGTSVRPFAKQPGQVLLPEACAVALRMTTAEADWVAVWRPQQRELQHLAAPQGWLAGSGLWTAEGELLLPYETPQLPCGLARVAVPVPDQQSRGGRAAAATPASGGPPGDGGVEDGGEAPLENDSPSVARPGAAEEPTPPSTVAGEGSTNVPVPSVAEQGAAPTGSAGNDTNGPTSGFTSPETPPPPAEPHDTTTPHFTPAPAPTEAGQPAPYGSVEGIAAPFPAVSAAFPQEGPDPSLIGGTGVEGPPPPHPGPVPDQATHVAVPPPDAVGGGDGAPPTGGGGRAGRRAAQSGTGQVTGVTKPVPLQQAPL